MINVLIINLDYVGKERNVCQDVTEDIECVKYQPRLCSEVV